MLTQSFRFSNGVKNVLFIEKYHNFILKYKHKCARCSSPPPCFSDSAARLHAAPPPLRLHTVLAPQRRTVSPVVPPVAALFTEPSSETAAAPPTTDLQLHPHCLMIRGLSLNNAGAPLQGSLARSPPSLSAGQCFVP